jgi:putative hydrolase of the HAD superfamily
MELIPDMAKRFTPKPKKVLFFDLNNTIVDPQSTLKHCFLEIVKDWSGRWAEETNTNPQELWERFQQEWKKQEKTRAWPRRHLRLHCLRKALKSLPLGGEAGIARLYEKIRELESETAIPYPDAVETVTKLGQDYRIAIISNGSRAKQWVQLEKLGLNGIIPHRHLIVSQQLGIKKPHPAIFRIAMQHLSTVPHQCVMIGDSWRNDIMGACKAGMDAVWVRRHVETKKPTQIKLGKSVVLKISALKQLTEYL